MVNGNLPSGWTKTTIGEVGKVKGGKRLPQGHSYSNSPTRFPYIRVTDFADLTINTQELKYLPSETQQFIKQYTISKDDVFISIAGSIGKVGVIPEHLDGANLTENAAKITDLTGIKNKFVTTQRHPSPPQPAGHFQLRDDEFLPGPTDQRFLRSLCGRNRINSGAARPVHHVLLGQAGLPPPPVFSLLPRPHATMAPWPHLR
jgi:hypothetical protein